MQTVLRENEIEVPGHGRIEIHIHGRNDLMLYGEIDGVEIDDFNVDRPHGAKSWGPGWMIRQSTMAAYPAEKPPPRIQKIIVAEIEKWAALNSFRLDLYGQEHFAEDIGSVKDKAEDALEGITMFAEDYLELVLQHYGDWLHVFDGGELLGEMKALIALCHQVKQVLGKAGSDLGKLQSAIEKDFSQKFTINPDWPRRKVKAVTSKRTVRVGVAA
jgi:hypothetical protein